MTAWVWGLRVLNSSVLWALYCDSAQLTAPGARLAYSNDTFFANLFLQFKTEPKSGEVVGLFGVFDGKFGGGHIALGLLT